jgi:hypothetical protein
MSDSNQDTSAEPAASATEQVLTQLARQKWAADFRDASALESIYTADAEQVIYTCGPGGPTEVSRVRGRDEIVRFQVAGWERTADTWFPGKSIHLIGSCVAERTADGRIRCRSYASYFGLTQTSTAELRGYATYDDLWALEDGVWRLAYRETYTYGVELTAGR